MRATHTVADRRATALIDFSALKANLQLARTTAPKSSVVVVVKADAYGHGMIPIAHALKTELSSRDCFGVASLEEACTLRLSGLKESILLLEGFIDQDEVRTVVESGFACVIHSLFQLEYLLQYYAEHPDAQPIPLWLKADTGMHRLGLSESEFIQAWRRLDGHLLAHDIVCMSHFACADDPHSTMTQEQTARLHALLNAAGVPHSQRRISIAASAGILNWPETHYDYVRPGIMLYGGSSCVDQYGQARGLLPVMTLKARLIAIKTVPAGQSIGYGATYTCAHDTRIGIVSIGYGDGYPRHAPSGTPVLVSCGQEQRRAATVGRVSMDMIAIDLSECANASIGDTVVLWGEGLPADEIAHLCGTISYELFCQVTNRVHYIYS